MKLWKMKITKEQRENTRKTAHYLTKAFTWINTKQGYSYWEKIRDEILDIADEETKCEYCGK